MRTLIEAIGKSVFKRALFGGGSKVFFEDGKSDQEGEENENGEGNPRSGGFVAGGGFAIPAHGCSGAEGSSDE